MALAPVAVTSWRWPAIIILIDDRASSVSLPEVPLLGVLPGTGGLTRVTDKRHVRHDLAGTVLQRVEGVRGQKARTGVWSMTSPRLSILPRRYRRSRAGAGH